MIAFIIAFIIVVTPVQSPHIDWSSLTLDQQMALIDVWRSEPEPIIMPVQYSPRPLEPEWVRALIETFFQPEDVEWALRVSYCESHWDAHAANPTSSARGLFQAMEGWWGGDWGYPTFDPYDPVANTQFAAWLFYSGGPGHWVCK